MRSNFVNFRTKIWPPEHPRMTSNTSDHQFLTYLRVIFCKHQFLKNNPLSSKTPGSFRRRNLTTEQMENLCMKCILSVRHPQYWLDKCSSLLFPFYHTVSDKRRWEVPRDEAMLTVPHSLHAIPHLCIPVAVFCDILCNYMTHCMCSSNASCVDLYESTQMVYWCVARPTHHLTVPTVPYFMSRTNLSVHSLTSKSLCQSMRLCMSVN